MKEYFKISSGLKNLIGSDLITDNYVAVFELVKNSFDAEATEVKIIFDDIYSNNAKIIIQDNGNGMDYEDIKNKWLFVAYSDKKEEPQDSTDYRTKIQPKRYYAGAKGVGRFSCDRLGRYLRLTTKKNKTSPKIEYVSVDWKEFERDQKKEFAEIPVEHDTLSKMPYSLKHGTVLEISGVHKEEWNRTSLLRLKDKLTKLVRPDLNKSEDDKPFKINLIVPGEADNDTNLVVQKKYRDAPEGYIYRNTVNGEIKNFIFDELDIRTTKIITTINNKGSEVETNLIDRDNLVYAIREKNGFGLLHNIRISLYYLNRSAKLIFARRMGVDAVNYGNVFVYKNGFRILPFGEPKDDSLGIDARALQGFNRFIGTRNLIGQIEILGNNRDLRETTSRDGGLVKTRSYNQLIEYLTVTLRRLEKYIVDVTQWGVNDENIDNLNTENVKRELIKLISNITDDKDLIDIKYNKDILKIIDAREEKSATKLIKNFTRIAAESNNPQLVKDAKRLEKTLSSALEAKNSAELELEIKETERKAIEVELNERESQITFLNSLATRDFDQIISFMHQIGIYANTLDIHIQRVLKQLKRGESFTREEIASYFEKMDYENKKILSFANFVTKPNYKKESNFIKEDIVAFIIKYLNNSKDKYPFHILIKNKYPDSFIKQFKPIEMVLVIDTFLSNSKKHKSTSVNWIFKEDNNNLLVEILNDGLPLSKEILNPDSIFDKGITTTNGSGMGLFYAKQIIKNINGSIHVEQQQKGIKFTLRFNK